MRFERVPQGGGESDECTCPQCRGVELPDWLQRLEAPGEAGSEPPAG